MADYSVCQRYFVVEIAERYKGRDMKLVCAVAVVLG